MAQLSYKVNTTTWICCELRCHWLLYLSMAQRDVASSVVEQGALRTLAKKLWRRTWKGRIKQPSPVTSALYNAVRDAVGAQKTRIPPPSYLRYRIPMSNPLRYHLHRSDYSLSKHWRRCKNSCNFAHAHLHVRRHISAPWKTESP